MVTTPSSLASGKSKRSALTRPERGHLGLLKASAKHPHRKESAGVPAVRHLREIRTRSAAEYEVGQILTVAQFESGDRVDNCRSLEGAWLCWRGEAPRLQRRAKDAWAVGPPACTWLYRGYIWYEPRDQRSTHARSNGKRTSNISEFRRSFALTQSAILIAVKGSVPGAKGGLVMIRDAAKG